MSLNDSLRVQSQLLVKKSQRLLDASKSLDKIIAHNSDDIDTKWQTTIQAMKVYTITQELETSALGTIFDNAALKKYANLNISLQTRFDEQAQASIRQAWFGLMQQVADNLHEDPTTSEIDLTLGKQLFQMAHNLYGSEHADLKLDLWEQGFMGGHMSDKDFQTTPEILQWLDLAAKHYWLDKLIKIINRVGTDHDDAVLTALNTALTELYGDEQAAKAAAIKRVRQDDRLSKSAQAWLDQTKI